MTWSINWDATNNYAWAKAMDKTMDELPTQSSLQQQKLQKQQLKQQNRLQQLNLQQHRKQQLPRRQKKLQQLTENSQLKLLV